jgi:hypothetical protein
MATSGGPSHAGSGRPANGDLGFHGKADVPGARQRTADVRIFRAQFERDQPVAILAIGLKPVTDLLRAFAKYLGAFSAPDSYFVINHWIPLEAAHWDRDVSV